MADAFRHVGLELRQQFLHAVDRQYDQHASASGVGEAHGIAMTRFTLDPVLAAMMDLAQPVAAVAIDHADIDQGAGLRGSTGGKGNAERNGGEAAEHGADSR